MDIGAVMPLLLKLMGGGNSMPTQTNSSQNNIPKEILASYPTSILTTNKPVQSNQITDTQNNTNNNQNTNPQNLLLSLLQGNMGDYNWGNSADSGQNFDMLKNLLPLLQNITKQKNSPPKFSELKSVDEYVFD